MIVMDHASSLLYLGSTSFSRKKLLQDAQISFIVVEQTADESVCDWGMPLEKVVSAIAVHKMDHVILPDGLVIGQQIFVLTADTLSCSSDGMINGKPIDRVDAIAKIKSARSGHKLCTAFCLDKKQWNGQSWDLVERIQESVGAFLIFDVPDDRISWYLDNSIAMSCSGAIQVEKGLLFLKEIRGSYSAIVGLPLFEVRRALEKLNFSF